jgi:hypothetical protein
MKHTKTQAVKNRCEHETKKGEELSNSEKQRYLLRDQRNIASYFTKKFLFFSEKYLLLTAIELKPPNLASLC